MGWQYWDTGLGGSGARSWAGFCSATAPAPADVVVVPGGSASVGPLLGLSAAGSASFALERALAKCLHSGLMGQALQLGLLFVQNTCRRSRSNYKFACNLYSRICNKNCHPKIIMIAKQVKRQPTAVD